MIIVYLLHIKLKTMATLTEKTQGKKIRNAEIKKLYTELMTDPDSQRTAVYEMLAFKYKVSSTTVGRIVGNIKTKSSKQIISARRTPKR